MGTIKTSIIIPFHYLNSNFINQSIESLPPNELQSTNQNLITHNEIQAGDSGSLCLEYLANKAVRAPYFYSVP